MEIRDGFNLDSKREFYLYLVGRYSFPSDIISRLDKFMFPVELIDELEDAAKKWWGRIGYDREGIVREREYKTIAEAEAYRQGALDMKEQSDCEDDSPLIDYWASASNLPSREDGELIETQDQTE